MRTSACNGTQTESQKIRLLEYFAILKNVRRGDWVNREEPKRLRAAETSSVERDTLLEWNEWNRNVPRNENGT